MYLFDAFQSVMTLEGSLVERGRKNSQVLVQMDVVPRLAIVGPILFQDLGSRSDFA